MIKVPLETQISVMSLTLTVNFRSGDEYDKQQLVLYD